MKTIVALRNQQSGFTILELLIATTVFGVMMLFATTGMIEIGRAYYKGITSAKTQEITRAVERDLSYSVQGGKSTAVVQGDLPSGYSGEATNYGIKSLCVGKSRYSYVTGVKSANSNKTSDPKSIKHVVWYDYRQSESGSCTALDLTKDDPSTQTNQIEATNTDSSAEAVAQRRDLLATNMRLARFDIQNRDTGIAIGVRVIYGDDDVIDGGEDESSTIDDVCKSSRIGGQFCAFSELNSFIAKR